MRIDIDDQLLDKISIGEIRLMIGIWLYTEKDYSLGKAAEVAGLHKIMFQKELGKRAIPQKYSEADLEHDVAMAKRLG
jgi:predicted HTH domain antitoxin